MQIRGELADLAGFLGVLDLLLAGRRETCAVNGHEAWGNAKYRRITGVHGMGVCVCVCVQIR